jgi:hypothetical protein
LGIHKWSPEASSAWRGESIFTLYTVSRPQTAGHNIIGCFVAQERLHVRHRLEFRG